MCSNCGADPCYHQCFNSPHYYSPEQERYDDMMDDGSDDMRERYAATMESMQYEDHQWDDDDAPNEGLQDLFSKPSVFVPTDPDDIPF